MSNKYIIGQKVICIEKRCIVGATKLNPLTAGSNPYNKVLYPENDYIIYIYVSTDEHGNEDYKGTLDVMENQIEFSSW